MEKIVPVSPPLKHSLAVGVVLPAGCAAVPKGCVSHSELHVADRMRPPLQSRPGLEELQDTVRYETVTATQLILDEIEEACDTLSAGRSDVVC